MSHEVKGWLDRWDEGRIGFHKSEVNGHLIKFIDHLPSAPARVLVPLCGKSLDLAYLQGRGFEVVGVELSRKALEDFCAEQEWEPKIEDLESARRWSLPGITLYEGDWFALEAAELGAFEAVWDRASLIALPESVRGRYVEQLLRFTQPGTKLVTVTLDYDQGKMSGPPYAVPMAEVEALFGGRCSVERASVHDATHGNPRFVKSGLERVSEEVFLMTRLS